MFSGLQNLEINVEFFDVEVEIFLARRWSLQGPTKLVLYDGFVTNAHDEASVMSNNGSGLAKELTVWPTGLQIP
jgi:hypothetical protein